MTPDALIWDMGGVIYLTPFEILDEVEDAHGWPRGVLPRGPFGPGGDPAYARCSTGEISESDYWADFERRAADRGFPIDLRTEIDWTDKLRPEVMEAIESLQGVVTHATLSNDSSTWLGDHWWETWPYRHLFAEVTDVKTLGMRKPHPETYLTAARRLGLAPEQCLFIDDMTVNLRGAEAVGMPSFFFDHTQPRRSVRQLLRRIGAR